MIKMSKSNNNNNNGSYKIKIKHINKFFKLKQISKGNYYRKSDKIIRK